MKLIETKSMFFNNKNHRVMSSMYNTVDNKSNNNSPPFRGGRATYTDRMHMSSQLNNNVNTVSGNYLSMTKKSLAYNNRGFGSGSKRETPETGGNRSR